MRILYYGVMFHNSDHIDVKVYHLKHIFSFSIIIPILRSIDPFIYHFKWSLITIIQFTLWNYITSYR